MPCWSAFGSEKRTSEKTTTDCDVLRRLLEETSGISDEEKSTWMADLERDLIDAWIALLLTRLKKLRKIRLVWSFESTYVLSIVETTKFPKPKLKLPPPRSSNITDLDFHDVQMAVIK